jgi:hypothetical protein
MSKTKLRRVILFSALLFSFVFVLNNVSANNNWNDAEEVFVGLYEDEYICHPDCSHENDEFDYFKLYGYKGNIVKFTAKRGNKKKMKKKKKKRKKELENVKGI